MNEIEKEVGCLGVMYKFLGEVAKRGDWVTGQNW